MTLPKFNEIKSLINISDIDQEVFTLQKNLFDLKMKKSLNQNVKTHLFIHTKRRIAQLKFKKSLLLKSKKVIN
jgi:ribosomal protein L29